MVSTSWRAMRSTGLSEVIGSWNTIAMPSRRCRQVSGYGRSRSSVANRRSSSARPRIEPVADAVAKEVEAEHHGQDRQARKCRDPPLLDQLAPLRDHRAPFGRRRNDAEAE